MDIERAKDGSGMVLTSADGQFMKIPFMEFWDIVKAGDRMDTLSEVEDCLENCDEIGGMQAEDILKNEGLMNTIVEKVRDIRISAENSDQIYDAIDHVKAMERAPLDEKIAGAETLKRSESSDTNRGKEIVAKER